MQDIKCNVILLGKTGAGKSSFANYLFGTDKFTVGTGKPVTNWEQNFQFHSLDIQGVTLNIYDTVGLEADNYQNWISNINIFLDSKQSNKNPNEIIHTLFYVVNCASARIEEKELDELYNIQKKYNLSTAIILTNCDVATEEQKQGLVSLIDLKGLKQIPVCSISKKTRAGKITNTFGKDESLSVVLSSSYEKVGKELANKSLEIVIDKIEEFKREVINKIDKSNISLLNISNTEEEFEKIFNEEEFEKIFGSDIEDILPKEYLVYVDFLNNFYTIDYEGKCYMDKVSELVEGINFDSILEKSEVGKRIASIGERFENDSFFDKITAGLEVGWILLRLKTEITDALNEVLDLIINQFEIIKREINS